MSHRPGQPGDAHVIPPEPAVVDLHTHTSRSDGVLEPVDLLAAALAAGITTLAITDHDSLAAYRELSAADGRPEALGLDLIPAVEINSVSEAARHDGHYEGELHILGYGVNPASDEFEALLADQRAQRRRRFDRAVTRLRGLGLSVDAELEHLTFHEDAALGRPTLARMLVAAGHATSVDDAFSRILSGGRPGYVPREGVGPLAGVRAIRAAGGLAVLAHFAEAPDNLARLRELRDHGVGGLEVHYRGFGAATRAALATTAAALRFTATGGSDYHGDRETYAEAHARLWVPPEVGAEVRREIANSTLT
ncbi:MAG: PHP domain-containing protein [Chloroflexi bacterium]|nr:PHP domain-containing protein [Chloroflexota bacterium]